MDPVQPVIEGSQVAAIAQATVPRRSWIDPRLTSAYLFLSLQLAVAGSAVVAGWFTIAWNPLGPLAATVLAMGAIGAFGRRFGGGAVADIAGSLALFCGGAIAGPLCAAVLALSSWPLADHRLAAIDAALFGFDRDAFVAWACSMPWLISTMRFAYGSIAPQPFILLVALFLTGRGDRARTFLGAWFVALTITLAIFPFVPAVSTEPSRMTWATTLLDLRSGALRSFSGDVLTGIVAFPSFHACAAVLLGWGFRGLGKLGLPLVALNIAMALSAIVGGGHYLIDLVAGVAVAAAAIPCGKWLTAERR